MVRLPSTGDVRPLHVASPHCTLQYYPSHTPHSPYSSADHRYCQWASWCDCRLPVTWDRCTWRRPTVLYNTTLVIHFIAHTVLLIIRTVSELHGATAVDRRRETVARCVARLRDVVRHRLVRVLPFVHEASGSLERGTRFENCWLEFRVIFGRYCRVVVSDFHSFNVFFFRLGNHPMTCLRPGWGRGVWDKSAKPFPNRCKSWKLRARIDCGDHRISPGAIKLDEISENEFNCLGSCNEINQKRIAEE